MPLICRGGLVPPASDGERKTKTLSLKNKTPSSKTGKFLEVSETFFKKDLTKNYGM